MFSHVRKPNRFWSVISILIVASMACTLGSPDPIDVRSTPVDDRPTRTPRPTRTAAPEDTPAADATSVPVVTPQSGSSIDNLIAATVQIYALFNGQPAYGGSGTLLTRNGMILTNAHVASPASRGQPELEPDSLAIGLVQSEDQPPVFTYLAEVQAVDGFLDLAVIQIVAMLDGTRLNPNDLNLPFVPMGDSDLVRVGDRLNIFGFPGIGGDTLTFTTGNVSGFTAEDPVGNRAWMKTDATIAGGNSGGLGANDNGAIIGVPTRASSGAEGGNVADCRVVQDTNGDGILDNRDTCIPIGGFLNALRPINLALPLIEAAERGRGYVSPYGNNQQGSNQGSGQQQFGPVTWYTRDRDGRLQDTVTSYPSDAVEVVAAFDFTGMTNGEVWGERWSHEGQAVLEDTYTWDLGASGGAFSTLNNNGNPMPPGTYSIELFAGPDLQRLSQGSVTVGGGGGSVTPPSSGSVQIYGVIFNGDTNSIISGAQFVVLMPGVTFDAWDGSNAQVYTSAKTDASGFYVLPKLLARDVAYTIVVGAQGYRTKYGDGLVWTAEDPNEYEMNVALVK